MFLDGVSRMFYDGFTLDDDSLKYSNESCVQSEKSIEIHADIPGVTKEDIKLDVEKDVLSLSVDCKKEAKEEKEENGVKWHHTERSHSFIKRSLRLPETADMENIQAGYQNGVLKVVVPKREVQNKNKRIAIS
jgi:HSP20 family protein